jgi:DNA repair exonuclease SbcCD ATPase subunit
MEEPKEAIAPVEGQEPEVSIDELKAQLEQARKSQAGVDKSYAEAAKKAAALQAEVEKLQKEKMSEKERAEFELAKKEAELEQRAREVAEATSRLSKMKLMAEKQIPADLADYIQGTSEEEILASINTFTERFEKAVGDRVQKTLTSTQMPKAGAEQPKQNNLASMSLAAIEQLAREGKL